jgi:hypothetical protein
VKEPAGFAPRLLIAELADSEIEFCVVGAFALAAHGVPRATAEVEIAPASSVENLARLAQALHELEARWEPGGPLIDLTPEVDRADLERLAETEEGRL